MSKSSISRQLTTVRCAGRKSFSPSTEIRLVLLGKTGSGKSSTANSILGRKVFNSKTSSSSVTLSCHGASGEVSGRRLALLDTPGLLDTHQTPQEVLQELRRSVTLMYPGPHVFLLVIQIGRFTAEEKEAVRRIKQTMGTYALSFSVVVFTHGDLLEDRRSVKSCLINGCRDLAELVAACGGRHCVFNNRSSKNKEQVSELLALVDDVMQGHGETCYNVKMLQKAEEELAKELQEELRLLNEKEETLVKKQEAAIRHMYEKELEMIQQKSRMELDELQKKLEQERDEEEKLVRNLQEALRRGMEEYDKKEKERRIQDMQKVMEIRREEEEKRDALQVRLNQVTKTLQEREEQGEKTRRAMEEKIQKERVEKEKKEREREHQQIQREQAIRQREETRRDVLQKELHKLTQSLQEQSSKEQDRRKQMEDLLRRQREEHQRERAVQEAEHREEQRRTATLKQELRLVRMEVEKLKADDENLKKLLWRSSERDTPVGKKFDGKSCGGTGENSAEKRCTVTTVIGFGQEMGLMGLNAALGSVGAPCCIQ